MFSYYAYGLGISSELLLPELIENKLKTDVVIRLANIGKCSGILNLNKPSFWANESEAYRFIPYIGSFLIRHGYEIVVDPVREADKRLFRQYLLGNIFGTLLHQRKLLVLHGSSVEFNGGAIVFLGTSGSGKSTLAASLNEKGYPIIADDVLAVDTKLCIPIVNAAFPQLKLLPDVTKALGYSKRASTQTNIIEGKHVSRPTSNFSMNPLPLKRIYLLRRGDAAEIQPLDQKEAMMELVRNSYAANSLNEGINLPHHFAQCAKIVKSVPIYRLIRSSDLKDLPDFSRFAEDDIKRSY